MYSTSHLFLNKFCYYCDSAVAFMVVVKVSSQMSSGPQKLSNQPSFFFVIFLLIALFLEVSLFLLLSCLLSFSSSFTALTPHTYTL